MNLKQKLMNWIVPDLSTPRGNYHATMFTMDDKPYKLFLMVDGQGLGTLVINASTVVNLNQTSTDMVYKYLQGASLEQITRFINNKYNHAKASAGVDFEVMLGEIEGYLSAVDLNPTSRLNGDATEPKIVDERYGLLGLDPIPGKAAPEISFWKMKIDELVEDGFPQINFVTSQMLDFPGLEELVAYTEEIGVVCVLVTVVTERNYDMIARLLRVGLDHLVLLPTVEHEVTAGMVHWLNDQDLYFDVLLDAKDLVVDLSKTVEELINLGVRNFNVPKTIHSESFDKLRELIAKAGGSLQVRSVPYKLIGANLTQSEIGNVVLADGLRYFI